jgi:hypothetical protein
MLSDAERAASSGDLASAEELLRHAAELQEAELGPLHPDLANTLNNLAIVAEKTGRRDDAENFYRRAVAIASASLSPDDPMVAASRQNLEEFCRAHGLPFDRPAVAEPAIVEPAVSEPAVSKPAAATTPAPPATAAAPPAPAAAPPAPASAPAAPPPVASPQTSRVLPALAIAAVALVAAVVFIARPRPPRELSGSVPAAAPPAEETTSRPAEPPPQPTSGRVAPEAAPPPTIDRAPAPAHAAIALVSVQLCRTFSTSDFRCGPAGDSTAPGPIVLYTRVRSPRDSVIIHRWFRGDTLVKSAQLRIGANAAEGYRTYSRETVESGDWRVEVRTAEGELLHEQRLAVR